MTQTGVFVGNSTAAVSSFEGWLGADAEFVVAFLNHESWSQFDSSIDYNTRLWAGHDVLWSIPLVTVGASLSEAAKGTYNDHFLKAARAILAATPGDEPIRIRPGWEFNGDWYPWAASGREQAYIGAFRQLVDAFRSISDRFEFEWTPTVGTGSSMNPELAYPGDDYVDVIGMNFYYNRSWDPADPAAAWQSMVERDYGLQWHQDFATAHSKPTAHSEWGINSENSGAYVALAASWFERHEVLYQAYWNSDSSFRGKLSSNQYPQTGQAFIDAFGGDSPYVVSGTAGADTLVGTQRGELFRGGAGPDRMSGGLGDDTYIADDTGDAAIEAPDEGRDSVRSYLPSYALPANVEDLRLMTGGAQTGIGNALANRIVGGAGANVIDGRGGNDLLTGGLGSDIFVFAPGANRDVITDFDLVADRVRLENFGWTSFDQVRANLATFAEGAVLSLPTGDSILFRGITVAQLTASHFTFAGSAVERPDWNPIEPALAPTPIQTWKTGTAGADVLTGGSYNNFIDGNGGADTMTGGGGHDVYVVDLATDRVVEYGGEGIDTVNSWSPSYTLPAHVEHLTLSGNYAQAATGNELANRLTGGAGANTLDGRGGDDLLKGGAGADTFVFRPGSDHDIIVDFEAGTGAGDRIKLEGTGLTSFAQVKSAMTSHAEGTVLTLDSGDTILFRNIAVSQFAADDFWFV